MAFTAVYDACVLYPATIRDLLLEMGLAGEFRARYTEEILDEVFRNILDARKDLDPKQLERSKQLMREAIPDVLVEGHMSLVDSLELPDPDDRHVLAAAIVAKADVIVTENIKDFPADKLEPYGIEAQRADVFIHHAVDLHPGLVISAARRVVARLRNPPVTITEYLDNIEHAGLVQTAVSLRELGIEP